MAKYSIEYDRDGCIGAGACVDACSENWELAEDGKANFKSADFDDDKLECNKAAAEACPVNIIHIKNNETGERLI